VCTLQHVIGTDHNLHSPADLLDDRQLIQVERGSMAGVIRQLHDVLSILVNVLVHIGHTQQLLN